MKRRSVDEQEGSFLGDVSNEEALVLTLREVFRERLQELAEFEVPEDRAVFDARTADVLRSELAALRAEFYERISVMRDHPQFFPAVQGTTEAFSALQERVEAMGPTKGPRRSPVRVACIDQTLALQRAGLNRKEAVRAVLEDHEATIGMPGADLTFESLYAAARAKSAPKT